MAIKGTHSSGYSLLELMVTLAVFGIVVAFAVPAVKGMIEGNTLSSRANDYLGAALFARSEAATRRSPVSICAMKSGADNLCGTSYDWQNGWLIFDDLDGDAFRDEGESVIKSVSDYKILNSLKIRGYSHGITFDELGTANRSLVIALCNEATGRFVIVSKLGSPEVSQKSDCPNM
jgi:type IV fimbrial biogenesis protein FimT